MAILRTMILPITIDIEGYQSIWNIEVTYTYYGGKPETDYEPAEPPAAEIITASYKNEGIGNIFNMVSKDIWKELEQRIVDEME